MKEDLQRLADEQNRSLTNYVESIFKKHAEQKQQRRKNVKGAK